MSLNLDADLWQIIYSCNRASNVETLQELCATCPIPKLINDLLPEVQTEIQTHKQAQTRTGFIQYCEAKLAYFAKEAGEHAVKLSTPPEGHGSSTPGWIWYKFYCLAVCQLYKAELESPPAARSGKSSHTSLQLAELCTLSASDVKAILKEAGMGSHYTRQGDWALAFRALAVKGVLKGNPYQVAQWAAEQGYTDAKIRRTISNVWTVSGADELDGNEKALFNRVTREAHKMLNNRNMTSSDR